LALLGKKVLLLDADPQANATSGLGFDIELDGIYECIIGDKSAEEVILQSPDIKKLWLLPSSIKLVAADTELPMMENAHFVIKEIINQVRDKYDYIFVDCSPSLGYTTVNILTASDSVLIPVQCEYLALEGLSKLLNTIKLVKNGLNPDLEIEGFVLTMYMRNRLNNQVANEVREHFGELAFDTVIQRNIRLGEAPSHGKPVMLYDAAATGSVNYLNLARELLKRNRKKDKTK
jgi:chromosome partitioning protein